MSPQKIELLAGETARLSLWPPVAGFPRPEEHGVLVSGTLSLQPGMRAQFKSLRWARVESGRDTRWPIDETGRVVRHRRWSDNLARWTDVEGPFEPVQPGSRRASDDSGAVEPVSGTTDVWETRALIPGNYTVEVRPFGHVSAVQVGPQGATEVALEVPALAEVLVHAISPESGRPLAGVPLEWSNKQGARGMALETGPPGTYQMFVPPGDMRVTTQRLGLPERAEELTVEAGVQEFTLAIFAGPELTLVLLDGETPIQLGGEWWSTLNIKRVDDNHHRSRNWRNNSLGRLIEFSEPGRYRFELGDLEHYLPLEPFEADLERGGNRIELRLVRKP